MTVSITTDLEYWLDQRSHHRDNSSDGSDITTYLSKWIGESDIKLFMLGPVAVRDGINHTVKTKRILVENPADFIKQERIKEYLSELDMLYSISYSPSRINLGHDPHTFETWQYSFEKEPVITKAEFRIRGVFKAEVKNEGFESQYPFGNI